MSKHQAIRVLALLSVAAGAPVVADPVQDLTSFTAGTPARAAEVNGNFSEVADSVNDNDARIAELEDRIATLEAQLGNLLGLNDYLSLETVNGQPTVRVTAANLQIVNGLQSTATSNGTGNLLVGYDEERLAGEEHCSLGADPNTGIAVSNEGECAAAGGLWGISHKGGSHYLIVGAEHNYSRWGGIVVGLRNISTYDFASVSGGFDNQATNSGASVSGGRFNTASGRQSSVSGGSVNTASAISSSVSGGLINAATAFGGSVSGGTNNIASGQGSSVSGGQANTASLSESSVSGGQGNTASGLHSTVSGGSNRSATGTNDWVAGSLFEDE